jgi:hypothetical protein
MKKTQEGEDVVQRWYLDMLNEDDSLASISPFMAVRGSDGGCLHSVIERRNGAFELSWEIFEEPEVYPMDSYTSNVTREEAGAIIAYYGTLEQLQPDIGL